MAEAYIIDACRTPRGIGKQGKGALAHLHPQHLAATVLKAIAERNNLKTDEIDECLNVKYVERIELTAGPGRDTRPTDEEEHAELHARQDGDG